MTSFLQLAWFSLILARLADCWAGGAPRCVFAPFHVNQTSGKLYPGPSKLEVVAYNLGLNTFMFNCFWSTSSPTENDFSFHVKLPSADDSEGMAELTVFSSKEFLGILVTTEFYEAERRPDMSLGHWWINESQWFKVVEDSPRPCGITHKK